MKSVNTTLEGNDHNTVIPMLIPELVNDQELAIVHLPTLKKIVSYLQTTNFGEVKRNFAEQIRNTTNLQEMVDTSKAEIVFHETCNLIKEFAVPKEESNMQAVREEQYVH